MGVLQVWIMLRERVSISDCNEVASKREMDLAC